MIFTIPGHGKGKHDGEAHVGKSESHLASVTENVQCDEALEPRSQTIANYVSTVLRMQMTNLHWEGCLSLSQNQNASITRQRKFVIPLKVQNITVLFYLTLKACHAEH